MSTIDQQLTVLVVGATGSIGRHVLTESVRQGHRTRALVRTLDRARGLDPSAEPVVGGLSDASTLADAVAGVDAVIFTHGDNTNAETVNYGAVRNVLHALDGRPVRIALMTTVGVTARRGSSEWKRRGERLVRASGNPYTIVRPGWFDYNDDAQLRITMLQGDTRQAGSPADGVVARRQIARVLVGSLTDPHADRRTCMDQPRVAIRRSRVARDMPRSRATWLAGPPASTSRRALQIWLLVKVGRRERPVLPLGFGHIPGAQRAHRASTGSAPTVAP